jgi:hypothetical protein
MDGVLVQAPGEIVQSPKKQRRGGAACKGGRAFARFTTADVTAGAMARASVRTQAPPKHAASNVQVDTENRLIVEVDP